jgi:hypothetical protein
VKNGGKEYTEGTSYDKSIAMNLLDSSGVVRQTGERYSDCDGASLLCGTDRRAHFNFRSEKLFRENCWEWSCMKNWCQMKKHDD